MRVKFPLAKNKDQKKMSYKSYRSDTKWEYVAARRGIRKAIKAFLRKEKAK